MKTWNQLFIRHGWLLKENDIGGFDTTMETESNLEYLVESLKQAGIQFYLGNGTLFIEDEPIRERKWLEILDFERRGRAGFWFQPGKEQPRIWELDPYICGIVRQLNRLGIPTVGSCDGHGSRIPNVLVPRAHNITNLVALIETLTSKRIRTRENRLHHQLAFPMTQLELLDMAEKLSLIEKEWLEKGTDFLKEQIFLQLLEQLLSIPGESGQESLVSEVVVERLTPYVDQITVDRTGNILAEKTYKGGNGPVILLNAHLDTVFEIELNRKIIKKGKIWTSSKGILGADDRAGVAILLHLAEIMPNSSFSGKVKFIFTVQEECGLIGAREVDDYFLWGTDAAIVVDRRGKGDIVTSCRGYFPFCDERFGTFFEQVALEENMQGWKTAQGGSSDTRIWAEHGIESVNLSVGYGNEHTEQEFLDVEACYQTTKLLISVFQKGKELRSILREIGSGRVTIEGNSGR